MASVLLRDTPVSNTLTCRPSEAVKFLRAWFADSLSSNSLISLFCLPSAASMFYPVNDLIDTMTSGGEDALDPLVWPAERPAQNIYFGVGLLKNRPQKGRGRASDVHSVPGVWADFDVKPGGFSSREAVDGAIAVAVKAGMTPSIVVRSGATGGAHVYWRVDGGLSPEDASMYTRMMRVWLETETEVMIDDVSEPNRVLRLPGTVWFPKAKGSASTPTPVRIVRSAPATLNLQTLTDAAGEHWTEREMARRQAVERRRALMIQSTIEFGPELAELMGMQDNRLGYRYALSAAEDKFMQTVSWDQILVPAGWQQVGSPDAEGRRQWRRPGTGDRNPRSLVTDWEGSPNVASLLSMAPETGLHDLYLAGLALTKVRVAAAFYADGDVIRLITSWIKSIQS